MSATPTTTTTYRAPDGSIIRDVQFNSDIDCYKWKDDQGKPCILKADGFEQMFTPVLEAEQTSPAITPVQDNCRTIIAVPFKEGRVSDGQHTFDELYEHRCLLFLAFCKALNYVALSDGSCETSTWMSRVHDDGSMWEGWFVAGIQDTRGNITYHLPERMWEWAVQCGLVVVEKASPYDGHDSFDVLARLADFVSPLDGTGTIRADEGTREAFAPLAVVEERSTPPDANGNLTFGQALEALKRGERVAREGWNGKGMFVYYVPANAYPAQTGVAKAYFGEDAKVPYAAYLAIKNVNETVSTWVPSINDCLSEDWCIL